MPAAPQSVREVLGEAAAALARAGVENPGNDARRLLAAAVGLSAAQLLARPEQVLTSDQADEFAASVARRAAREPVSRILGVREFYGRPFRLSAATLDPRADTETLIDVVLDHVRAAGLRDAPLRILDVGTGTGCLLVTLLCELPQATGIGTEISDAALETARENADALGVRLRAEWRLADLLDGVEGPFDVLVSNPPYIRSADIAGLEPEVRTFDPHAALDGGGDGLEPYRRMVPRLPQLVPNGSVVLEVGHDQADAVAGLLAHGRSTVELIIHKDVAGMRRCVACRTRS